MDKILLITTFYYPQNRIPVLRVAQWAKYWAEMGYEVTVLTTKKYSYDGPFGLNVQLSSNVKVVEVDYLPSMLKKRFSISESSPDSKSRKHSNGGKANNLKKYIRKARGYVGSLFNIYDLWVNKATKEGVTLFEKNHYSLMVSSYSPPASHVVASNLKALYPEVKWVADFRDLWVYNHLMSAKLLFGVYEKYKEKKTIKHANLLVTVSDPLTDVMLEQYPSMRTITVENGFDPDEFPDWKENIETVPRISKALRIVYAGTIYEGKRDPAPLFEACNELIDEGHIDKGRISIDFYGNNTKEITNIIIHSDANRYNIIKLHGFVSREKSLKVQQESDLLMLLEWNDPSARGVLTGKLFEYLVSGKPILGVGIDTRTAAGELIERTGTGKACVVSADIKQVLVDCFHEGAFNFYQPITQEIGKYSRKKQSEYLLDTANTCKSLIV